MKRNVWHLEQRSWFIMYLQHDLFFWKKEKPVQNHCMLTDTNCAFCDIPYNTWCNLFNWSFFLSVRICLVQRQQDSSLADQKKALYKKDTLSEELLWDKSPNVFCCPGQVFLDGKAKQQVEAETKSEVSNWKVLKFWARVKKNLDFGFHRVKCFNIQL